MAPVSAQQLRAQLRSLGLSNAAIDAAWPRWWSAEAESSASARAELAFGVARRLGLEPESLIEISVESPASAFGPRPVQAWVRRNERGRSRYCFLWAGDRGAFARCRLPSSLT